jgi:hypothetical protein
LTVGRIKRWQAERLASGVRPASVRKSMMVLSGILQAAVEDEEILSNPLRAVSKTKIPKRLRSAQWFPEWSNGCEQLRTRETRP